MEKLRRFLVTEKFFVLFALLALLIDIIGTPSRVVLACGILFLCALIGVIALISEDLMPILSSGVITALVACRCYNGYNLFMGQPLVYVTVPVAVFTVSALVYNFIRFRKPIKAGRSIRGVIAVAIAVTLGGLGKISFGDYLSSAYYVVFLGVGMVALYLVFKSRFYEREDYNIRKKFAAVLCIMGVFAAVLTLKSFIVDLGSILEFGSVPDWQFRNNFSTFMIIAMPAPLMFVKKHRWMLALPFVIYVAMVFLGSRGGLFMGAAEFVCCLIFMSAAERKYRWAYVSAIVVFAIAFVFSYSGISEYYSSRTGGGLIDAGEKVELEEIVKPGDEVETEDLLTMLIEKAKTGEQRVRLLLRSVEDFWNSPVFGQGLGYKGNYDIYAPKKGAMGWYHMMVPQVIGSMGLIGILAYGFQFLNRMKLVLKSKRYDSWVLWVCYLGLFFMSQVNPGEFCPLPYELIAVMIFILIEGGSPAKEWGFVDPPVEERLKEA